MYDMTRYKPRYFDIKLKNNKILNIEPPKMKVLKKITSLSKTREDDNLAEDDILNLNEAVALAISKNKQGYKISAQKVEEEFDIFELLDFLNAYFAWVNEIQNSKN